MEKKIQTTAVYVRKGEGEGVVKMEKPEESTE